VSLRAAVVIALATLPLGIGRLRVRGASLRPLWQQGEDAREARLQDERPYPEVERVTPWVAGREADGREHVVFGSMRVDVHDGHYVAAGDRTEPFLAFATPVRDGWVFVA